MNTAPDQAAQSKANHKPERLNALQQKALVDALREMPNGIKTTVSRSKQKGYRDLPLFSPDDQQTKMF